MLRKRAMVTPVHAALNGHKTYAIGKKLRPGEVT